jgi:hypothetical protein
MSGACATSGCRDARAVVLWAYTPTRLLRAPSDRAVPSPGSAAVAPPSLDEAIAEALLVAA